MEMQIGKQDEKDEKKLVCVRPNTATHHSSLSKQPHFRPYKTL